MCGTTSPTSQRRHRKKLNKTSTTYNPSSTVNPFESEIANVQPTKNSLDKSADHDLMNQNMRRHSQEDYDIDCDSAELDSVVQPTTSFSNEFFDKPNVPFESHSASFVTPRTQTSTIGESLRRMSESEEISTECDSVEDIVATTTSKPIHPKSYREFIPENISLQPNQLMTAITLAPDAKISTEATTVTTIIMRRMSESEEIQTDCESDKASTKIDQPETEQYATKTMSTSFAIHSTQTEETIDPTQERLTINELSRRMSESDADCKNDKGENGNGSVDSPVDDKNSMTPIRDSMRRMSESNENSADCDSHEDNIDVTTSAASISPDSMRRMSHSDKSTSKIPKYQTDPVNPTIVTDYPETEYVTECATVAPLPSDAIVSEESANDSEKTMEINVSKDISLLCCPDSVCSLLYPNVPDCDARRTVPSNFIRKIDELRNMFYLYETQVLITKMVADSDSIRKRMIYERELVRLWNDILSIAPIDITNGCTEDSSSDDENGKQIISTIYCFLKYTDSLLNDTFLEIVLNVVKRIEANFPRNKVLRYHKLRRIILQSIPKALNQADPVALLSHYMQHNQNYENERTFLLHFLFDIQESFESNTKNQFINQIKAKKTDSSESLQENGLGIKMHRTSN